MKDKILIMKIQGYIERVRRIYWIIKDLDEQEILLLDDSFALTQFITNIDSLFSLVSSDAIASKQVEMGIRPLKVCRNIASHDYDSLDWNRIKRLCGKLTSERTAGLLEECLGIAEEEERGMKDYSSEDERGGMFDV